MFLDRTLLDDDVMIARNVPRRADHRAAQFDTRAVVGEDLALLTTTLYQIALPLRHVAATTAVRRLVAGVAAAGGSHVGRAPSMALAFLSLSLRCFLSCLLLRLS